MNTLKLGDMAQASLAESIARFSKRLASDPSVGAADIGEFIKSTMLDIIFLEGTGVGEPVGILSRTKLERMRGMWQ